MIRILGVIWLANISPANFTFYTYLQNVDANLKRQAGTL